MVQPACQLSEPEKTRFFARFPLRHHPKPTRLVGCVSGSQPKNVTQRSELTIFVTPPDRLTLRPARGTAGPRAAARCGACCPAPSPARAPLAPHPASGG